MNTRGKKRSAEGETDGRQYCDLLQHRNVLKTRVTDLLQDQNALQMRVAELEQENGRFRNVLEKMKSKVECPVCLVVPRAGPVPQCPNGHFICSPCRVKERVLGREDCPTCRVPMVGEAKSILASLVIENVKHECSYKDCEENVDHDKYERHQEVCKFRPVRCPGNCGLPMAFKDIARHAMIGCQGRIEIGMAGNIMEKLIPNIHVGNQGELHSSTMRIDFHSRIFFFQLGKAQNIYFMEVVMLGPKEDCDKYRAEISVLDTNLQQTFKFRQHPRPIGLEMWGEFTLTIREATLLKICDRVMEDTRYRFRVKIDITHC
jgi:hypothetical protein